MIDGIGPYLAMRDSGAEWFGDVPAHWECRRLKTLCEMQSGEAITAESIEEAGQYPVYGGNGLRGFSSMYTHDGAYVLIGRQGALCGNVHRVRGRFWASEHAVVATLYRDHSPGWFASLLQAMNLNQYSISAAQPGLSVDRVSNLWAPVPPQCEQAPIARFLDHIDHRIQKYIRAKEKLIALLDEYKQALIHQAVTGQIDVRTGKPYGEYKESGVEWLGRVPMHWDVAALRHRYQQSLGKMLDAKQITGQHPMRYLRNVDVQWDDINVLDLPLIDIRPNEIQRYTVLPGDVLVCEGGEVGRAAIWNGDLDVCAYQKALHRLRPCVENQELPRFLLYALMTAVAMDAFCDGHETTIAHLTGEKLRAHRFAFPPFLEQQSVVEFLDNSTAKISLAVKAAQQSIDCFSQYRTRLIADIVTGKLDVREAAAGPRETDSPVAEPREA